MLVLPTEPPTLAKDHVDGTDLFDWTKYRLCRRRDCILPEHGVAKKIAERSYHSNEPLIIGLEVGTSTEMTACSMKGARLRKGRSGL